ncbi:hypothetical protein RYX36_026143 [Vicia faba]
MIKGWQIYVAQIISNEIRNIEINCHTLGNKVEMTLAYPSITMGLCRHAGVEIPEVATKVIRSIVNEDYVLQHCVPKLDGEGAPQPQAHAPPVGPAVGSSLSNSLTRYRMEASNVGLDGSVNSLKLVDYGDESTLIQWSFEINPLEDVSENNLVDYLGFLYKSCINKIEGAVEAASRNVSPP